MNRTVLFFGLIVVLLFSSCKSKKPALKAEQRQRNFDAKEHAELAKIRREKVLESIENPVEVEETSTAQIPESTSAAKSITELYIDRFKQTAMNEMVNYKIPASITLAQGILESGSGKGQLTSRSNNHFGIKCHKSWKGKSVKHDDDKEGECFRKYKDPEQSFRDHSLFLYGRERYASLFELKPTDYKGWAKGLKKAGYATDPAYPKKLIAIIERYQLQQFDYQVLGKNYKPFAIKAKKKNDVSISYLVKKGDTLYGISKKFGVSVAELKRLNMLTSNSIDVGQRLRVE